MFVALLGRVLTVRSLYRSATTVLAVVIAGLALGPAGVQARTQPPGIVGAWNVDVLGQISVREVRSGHWRGTVVSSPAGCLRPGMEIWHIDSEAGAYNFSGSVAFFASGCRPVGFGPTQWTLSGDFNSGNLCGYAPGGSPQTSECHPFTRVGSPPPAPAAYALNSVFISCTGEVAFFLTNGAYCNRYFYLPRPGRLQTTVMYCTEFSNGYSSLFGRLPVCPGYESSGPGLTFLGPRAKHSHRDHGVVLAKSVVKLKQAGYGGVDLKLDAKARARMRLVSKHHRKIPVTVVSIFTPPHGKRVIRTKHLTIKLR